GPEVLASLFSSPQGQPQGQPQSKSSPPKPEPPKPEVQKPTLTPAASLKGPELKPPTSAPFRQSPPPAGQPTTTGSMDAADRASRLFIGEPKSSSPATPPPAKTATKPFSPP